MLPNNRWSPLPMTDYVFEDPATAQCTPAGSYDALLDTPTWNMLWLLARPGSSPNRLAVSPESARTVVANMRGSLMNCLPMRTWAAYASGPRFVEMFLAAGFLDAMLPPEEVAEVSAHLRTRVKHLEGTHG